MKTLTLSPLRFIPAALCLAFALLAYNAGAANQYFDVNGATSGFGTADGGSYSWDDANWSSSSAGTVATTTWGAGNFPRFNGPGSYTVTVNNSESVAGAFQSVSSGTPTLTINAAGSGNLNILPNPVLAAGLPAQGVFCKGGQFLVINAPIIGTGGVIPSYTSVTYPNISLFGDNSYSGGTVLNSSYVFTHINNNHSFGTGPIVIVNTSFCAVWPDGGAPITLANSWTNFAGTGTYGINFVCAANTPLTNAGPLNLQASLNLRNSGDSTAPLTWSGIISGGATNTLNLTANSGGTIVLSGANTYTGPTAIGTSGNSGVTVSVASINSVNSGHASNLGAPTTAAAGTIAIGGTTNTCTLQYTGPGETSDRVINLSGAAGSVVLQADGSGALVLTADNTASGTFGKALTLQGSSTALNSIGKLVDTASGATAVVKNGSGTWKLTGANTYTGGTTVNQGILEISGSLAGDITVFSTLTLDNATVIPATSALTTYSGSTINLNFTGTNAINSLFIDGGMQVSGVWGAPGSGAPHTSDVFTGSGFIQVLGKPVVTQQPVSVSVFPDSTSTFSLAALGDQATMTYQWKHNGVNIPGANADSYTISPVEVADAGTYSCWLTNAYGWTNTANATLTVLATNDYVNAIRTASPIAYWRLDETSGTTAYDWIGMNHGTYINANVNQPGFSVVPGSDSAMGIPRDTAQKGYMVISNAAPFSFPAMPFTFEAWAMSTNFAAGVKQRIISTLTLSGAGGYGFGFPDDHTLQLTAGGVGEFNATISPSLASGVWYHFVVTCDGNYYTLYVNGNSIGNRTISGMALPASPGQFCVGNNPLTYPSEQLYGRVDEVAVYNYALDQATIMAHYQARYTDAPLTVSAPVANPSTNYVSLSATITEDASGAELTYQWYRGAGTGTPVGGNSSALTLSPLQLSDSGDYHVVVTDAANHTQDSPAVHLEVLPIPSSPSQLNLTNALVVHLGFDGDCGDISGRGNNGTPMQNGAAATANFVAPGKIGASALNYSTASGTTNYVTLGVRPDLQFGTSTDFTVAYWVRGTGNTKLPVFCNAANGVAGIVALGGGFFFGPNKAANGGWEAAVGGTAHEMDAPGDDIINDGNWHHMVFAGKRAGNMTVYLDGVQVGTHAMSYVTDSIDVANPANIGQDGTGALAVPDQGGDVDDLAVWRRVLTPFEVSGIYLAAATNGVTFAPPVAPLATPTTITSFMGTTLSYTGGGGSQFVLLGSPDLTAPVSGWTRMATNSTSPGSFSIPATGSPAAMFYRIKSE